MGRRPTSGSTAGLSTLYGLAADQGGYVSTSQARELGFSTARLQYQVNAGHLTRAARGVLRFRQFPASELEDYIVWWLWSDREGIFSHETALMLHQLSDAMPAKPHMTLPSAWAKRRIRIPEGVNLHFADVPEADRSWKDYVPVTSPLRTLQDCRAAAVSPEFLHAAIQQARHRGLIDARDARRLRLGANR
jgi:predicted transcriptional regulator of viral defense system